MEDAELPPKVIEHFRESLTKWVELDTVIQQEEAKIREIRDKLRVVKEEKDRIGEEIMPTMQRIGIDMFHVNSANADIERRVSRPKIGMSKAFVVDTIEKTLLSLEDEEISEQERCARLITALYDERPTKEKTVLRRKKTTVHV